MSDPFLPRVGGTLSADIAVPEHERELRFYSRVLTTGENPLWREDLINNLGMPIIGLGAHKAEYADLPLQWMPHIQVADVAASVERALVLLDPNGAAFGLIPVVSEEAIAPKEGGGARDTSARAGCIAWLDLTVSDASTTRDFYRQVIGWSVQDVAMEHAGERYADYNMLGDDGSPAAGVCHARGANLGLPVAWMIYLPVGDLAESLRRVRDEGGKVIKATQGADGEYAYAAIQDPVGACFALVPG